MFNIQEHIIYHFALSRLDICPKIKPEYFDSKNFQILYKIAQDYAIKYRCAPSAEQMKDLVKVEGYGEQIPDDSIDMLYASQSSLGQRTDDWLYENVIGWAEWQGLLGAVEKVVSYIKLKQGEVTPDNVVETCETVKNIFTRDATVRFDDSQGVDFYDAAKHKQVQLRRFSSGFDYVDMCLRGGYFSGSLICFVGAPKIGKSLWLQNLCANSMKMGINSSYVSLELPEEMVIERIGSNVLNIPACSYSKYADDTDYIQKAISTFRSGILNRPGDLIIKQFPTSAASVVDIESYLLEQEEERSTEKLPFKFKVIYVDYINIIKNYRNPNSEDTYMKIKQIAEDLRAMAIRNKWCIVTATQTKRDQFDSNDITVQQIAESVGLLATADALFGIVADTMMKAQGRYYLKCLADRVNPSENTRKSYTLNKDYLRIIETAEPIEDVTSMMRSIESPKLGIRKPSSFGDFGDDGSSSHAAPAPADGKSLVNITGENLFDI